MFDSLRQDITGAIRGLIKSPGFAAASLITLAIIGKIGTAGGTGQGAFAVDGTGGMTEKQLLETFNKIRGETFRCDFDIPAGKYSDPNLTNVETIAGTRPRSKLVKVPKSEDCARATQGGWYHDDASKRIQLCPEACRAIRMEPSVKVNIVVGCAAILL